MHFLLEYDLRIDAKTAAESLTEIVNDFVQSQIILMCCSRSSVCQGNPGSYTSPDKNVYRNRMLLWRMRGLGLAVSYNIMQ